MKLVTKKKLVNRCLIAMLAAGMSMSSIPMNVMAAGETAMMSMEYVPYEVFNETYEDGEVFQYVLIDTAECNGIDGVNEAVMAAFACEDFIQDADTTIIIFGYDLGGSPAQVFLYEETVIRMMDTLGISSAADDRRLIFDNCGDIRLILRDPAEARYVDMEECKIELASGNASEVLSDMGANEAYKLLMDKLGYVGSDMYFFGTNVQMPAGSQWECSVPAVNGETGYIYRWNGDQFDEMQIFDWVDARLTGNYFLYNMEEPGVYLKTENRLPGEVTGIIPLHLLSWTCQIDVPAGSYAEFNVEAEGEGLTYQWQYLSKGAKVWRDSSAKAAKSANFAFITPNDTSLNGRQYRCVVTDARGEQEITEPALLHVYYQTEIVTEPADVTAAAGEKATFSVQATGENLTYQWQYRNAGTTEWKNSGIKAAKTANMSFAVGTDKTLNGREYRCVIQGVEGVPFYTEAAVLHVASAGATITSQPTNVTAAAGEKATFSVKATGENLTYQWQYRNAGTTEWKNSGIKAAKTANMSFAVGTDKTLNGREYRCVITDKNGNAVTTNAAVLNVK